MYTTPARLGRGTEAVQHLDRNTETRLLRTLSDGRFASGTALGEALGIGRAGVARAVARLRQAGLRIDAVRGRGYRIPGGYDPLDAVRARQAWVAAGGPDPSRFECLYRPASTNEHALQTAERGTGVVFAEGQCAGRGRLGRAWVSPLGNIYLSVVHDFATVPEPPAPLALGVAVSLAEGLRPLGVPVQVKWPNDLLVAGRKIGGILTELRGDPLGPCRVVIGVGLNRYVPAATDHRGLSPGALTDAQVPGTERSTLAGSVAAWVAVGARRFERDGLAPLLVGWEAVDALAGQTVHLEGGGRTTSGVARGIDEHGRLRVETERGLACFASGEAHLHRSAS
ncbi:MULTISPECIES: biotin--[acetyl-CoA-carboxylase] ligase [unclassified Halorhodospira]|uniref:biotin--[acetyl-CoA-carboxylase] ligase n=1 Tax=unclassified Halorhodospira TaxID=2626748 RepID=UPI001EE800E6|nr:MULTISPECIES: biotin--[acetyl-CoA-carboxylase] ligase [unclassified Halorhodospira]MCG5542035.1 biotin--[acetyl-CoA-carboxylase] ligase [Halorhodospira sp. M39old]MCG5547082.1 biotin--[acetyl-CoA-carboxylase] ligase [Halorhodospira sp. M38]